MLMTCFQENAHFIVVDLVLEVLEGVKFTLGPDQWTSTVDSECMMTQRSCAEQNIGTQKHKDTRTESQSWCENQDEEPESFNTDHQRKTLSFLSSDSGFEGNFFKETSIFKVLNTKDTIYIDNMKGLIRIYKNMLETKPVFCSSASRGQLIEILGNNRLLYHFINIFLINR